MCACVMYTEASSCGGGGSFLVIILLPIALVVCLAWFSSLSPSRSGSIHLYIV